MLLVRSSSAYSPSFSRHAGLSAKIKIKEVQVWSTTAIFFPAIFGEGADGRAGARGSAVASVAVSTTEQREPIRRPDLAPQTAAAKSFRPDIEGLRAVAVLAVVLFHADLPGLGGGFVGVDVFFVISGFLITGLLWREASASGSVRLRKFFAARARRLLPASALVGVVTMVSAALLLPPLQVRAVTIDGITSALYVSNYWFIGSGVKYFGHQSVLSPSPFQHYWSLGVEEQFYLVWPLLIIGAAWIIRR